MQKDKLIVSEIFMSLQGEGITAGAPSLFLRLGGCNLLCGGKGTDLDKKLHEGAEWRCDTIEVWKKGRAYSFIDLLKELNERFGFERRVDENDLHLIITGGEPLMQQEAIANFITYLYGERNGEVVKGCFPFIEIETNGTILPIRAITDQVAQWNVSPKLANSGEKRERRIMTDALNYFMAHETKSIFKFVISKPNDWLEVRSYHLIHQFCKHKIWLMPAASDIKTLMERSQMVAEICIREGVCFSSRLQVAIWNETTGV